MTEAERLANASTPKRIAEQCCRECRLHEREAMSAAMMPGRVRRYCSTCGQVHYVQAHVEYSQEFASATIEDIPVKRCPGPGCAAKLCGECIANGQAAQCESCAAPVCLECIHECACGCRCKYCPEHFREHWIEVEAEERAGEYEEEGGIVFGVRR